MEKLFEYKKEYYTSQEYQNYSEWTPSPKESGIHSIDDFGMFDPRPFRREEWKVISTHKTKEKFEENLLNPLWNVSMSRYIMVIEKNEEKIRIKFYYYHKSRAAGRKFYKVTTSVKFYSYNYVKNALYEGSVNNFHKKRKFTKSMRRIGPNMNPMSSIRSHIQNMISYENYSSTISRLTNESFFTERADEIYKLFLNSIPGIENYNNIEKSDNRFYKLYYDKQNVKLPNNWESLIFGFPQPKLRIIRKNKFKYVDALMEINKLKGDKVRRVLHNVTNFIPDNFKIAVSMFGENMILQQPDEFVKKMFQNNLYLSACNLILPPKEKKNAFEIFKLVVDQQINNNTFIDHYIFYNSVSKFEKIKWSSKDAESFRQEHLDWTERHDFYTKGDYRRIYDQKFIDYSQEKIFDSQNNVYYPILLQSSKEYNEESYSQSNCVKTYIQKPNSLIISLRKGSKDSKERATIEFSILMVGDKIYLNRIQTLGRFNFKLDDSWVVPIALLDNRIRNSMSNFEYELPKIEAKFGHKTIVANGIFKKDKFSVFLFTEDGGREKNKTCLLSWDRNIGINNYEQIPMIDLDEIPY